MNGRVGQLLRDETGATILEYGMLATLIALLAIVFLTAIGGKVSNVFSNADSQLL
ncbi:Flp family type IVb pilin [Gemmatimonas sp.]|jgi:pilus assembly protein Flp/PilA|uniref:Flp family type IVb pilin n=1 Tax=Gemmatimonas sp. TaxID=1962908 RepID=UPI0037BED26D